MHPCKQMPLFIKVHKRLNIQAQRCGRTQQITVKPRISTLRECSIKMSWLKVLFNPDDNVVFYFISCTKITHLEPWPAVKVHESSEKPKSIYWNLTHSYLRGSPSYIWLQSMWMKTPFFKFKGRRHQTNFVEPFFPHQRPFTKGSFWLGFVLEQVIVKYKNLNSTKSNTRVLKRTKNTLSKHSSSKFLFSLFCT